MEHPNRVTYFGATDNRGKRVPFGIKRKDRARHMYVIGKTGMGKSTLLENMAIQDIVNGEGVAFIDPHGSAVETLLKYVPEHRVKDVVYFAPFDLENPIAFNVMEDVGYDKRHLVVSGLMATFKKIWVDAWSARMEYILTNTLLALLEYPDATLLGVNRMYVDKEYRKKVVENVKDPVVKDFWIKEFATFTDRYTQEATPAIQNKIGQFTSNPLIRNIIGQPKSSFDVRTLMDDKKILLINLSKGLVGDTNMKLLGSMLTTRIFLGAMSRADLPPEALKNSSPVYFYVDEFQNFANETFAEILSEARKYNLNLIIAHQYVEQMEEEVRAAVFGNVGTTVTFRIGAPDAEIMEVLFAPEFTKEDLVNLGFAQVYLTLMIDGVGSRPFSAVTLAQIEPPKRTYQDEVIAASRASFAGRRSEVEGAIYAELASIPTPEAPPPRVDWKKMKAEAAMKKKPNGNGNGNGNSFTPPRPQPQQQNSAPTDRRVEPARPVPPDRDSLKAALAEMTEKIAKANTTKQGEQHASFKEALAAVVPPPAQEPRPEQKKEATPQSAPVPPRPESQKPSGAFEVPEEELRAVFSDKG